MGRWFHPESSPEGQNPLLRLLGYYSAESLRIQSARDLCEGCFQAAMDHEVWRDRLGLNPEVHQIFATRLTLSQIHLWMTVVCLRKHGREGSDIMQVMYEKFWSDVEKWMIKEGDLGYLEMRKYVKESERVFFAMGFALDEAFFDTSQDPSTGFDRLVAGIQRNVSFARDSEQATRLATYIREELQRLDSIELDELRKGDLWLR